VYYIFRNIDLQWYLMRMSSNIDLLGSIANIEVG